MSQDEEVTKDVIPIPLCGIMILASQDGQGINIIAIPVKEKDSPVIREANPDDILAMISQAHIHITSNLVANKVLNMIHAVAESQKEQSGKKPKIFRPGRGVFGGR